jgi:hypothetical protein
MNPWISLIVPIPDDPSIPLGVVRTMLADLAGLSRDRFKLIFSGAVMKNDDAPISSYQLKPGCTITLMGTSDQLPESPSESLSLGAITGAGVGKSSNKVSAGPPTQQGTLRVIQAELDAVRTSLSPSVTSFLSSILPSPPNAPLASPEPGDPQSPEPSIPVPPPLSSKIAHEEYARLGEHLLQSLLRLDAIMPESEWADARFARKGAVKEVQGLLDDLDEGWRTSGLGPTT